MALCAVARQGTAEPVPARVTPSGKPKLGARSAPALVVAPARAVKTLRARADSNGRPLAPEASALSTELRAQGTPDSKGLSAHSDARATPSTLRNTPCAKAEESTTPDLVELTRRP